MTPTKIRISRRRGKLQVTTYGMGARGARRLIGTYTVQGDDLAEELRRPEIALRLGLVKRG